MVDSALPIYGIFSALQSTTRTGALNVLYGLKSGGGESMYAVLCPAVELAACPHCMAKKSCER